MKFLLVLLLIPLFTIPAFAESQTLTTDQGTLDVKISYEDIKTGGIKFIPLISPQVKKDLEEKKNVKQVKNYKLTIKRATPDQPIVLYFD